MGSTVTSQVYEFPACFGMSVRPSGLLLSTLLRPTDSFVRDVSTDESPIDNVIEVLMKRHTCVEASLRERLSDCRTRWHQADNKGKCEDAEVDT